MEKIKYLPVGGIETEGLQIRAKMDPDVILDYAEAMKGGKKFPPLLTFYDGATYFLADGFHRLHAAVHLKLAKIACDVRDGTMRDARLAACGANQLHGLRRKVEDKRRAVRVVLELRPEWSDRMISEHVGVSNTFVGQMRQLSTVDSSNVRIPRQLHDFGPPPSPPLRIGRDGKFREAPPVRSLPPVSSSAKETAGVSASEDDGGVDGAVASAAADTTDPGESTPVDGRESGAAPGSDEHGPVDSLGRHVPQDLAPLWHRRQEVQDILTAISRVRSAIRHAQESRDPLWAEVNFSAVLAQLDRVYTDVDATKPYVVCPMCQGIGCRACRERGLLGKFLYDTVIPRELKIAPPGRRD